MLYSEDGLSGKLQLNDSQHVMCNFGEMANKLQFLRSLIVAQ